MSTPPSGELSGEGLKEATVSGVRWMTLARAVAEALAFGSTVVLAHLIPPAEYGRVAIALIVSAIAMGLTSEGFGNPLVQRRAIERAHVESALLMSVGFGLALAVSAVLLAPLICDPLFGERTTELVQLASLIFVFVGLSVVPSALLQRKLDFRRIGVIEMAAGAAGTSTSVVLAILGLDAEAIVLGAICTSALSAVLLLATSPVVPLPGWHRREVGEIASFGVPAALASLVNVGFRNVDYAILGARTSAAQVGFYYRAFGLGVNYQMRVTNIMQRVSFPVYSRTESIEELRAFRGRIVQVNAAVIFPALALLVATAPVLIPWLFGSRWEPSALPAQILAVAGMAAAVSRGIGPLLLAAGHPRALLGYHLGTLVLYAGAVFFTAPLGLAEVCVSVLSVYLVGLVAGYYLLERLLGIRVRRLWDDVAPATVASLALLAVAFPLTELLSSSAIPTAPALLAVGAAGLSAYAVALRWLFPSAWRDLTMLVRRALSGEKRTGDAGRLALSDSPAATR
jgi:O-antigen/teichoic acid export membrane protein